MTDDFWIETNSAAVCEEIKGEKFGFASCFDISRLGVSLTRTSQWTGNFIFVYFSPLAALSLFFLVFQNLIQREYGWLKNVTEYGYRGLWGRTVRRTWKEEILVWGDMERKQHAGKLLTFKIIQSNFKKLCTLPPNT